MINGDTNCDFFRQAEASIFIAEQTVRLLATLVDRKQYFQTPSPRRVFHYDPTTFDSDLHDPDMGSRSALMNLAERAQDNERYLGWEHAPCQTMNI